MKRKQSKIKVKSNQEKGKEREQQPEASNYTALRGIETYSRNCMNDTKGKHKWKGEWEGIYKEQGNSVKRILLLMKYKERNQSINANQQINQWMGIIKQNIKIYKNK